MEKKKIAVLVGSLRKESYNRKLAKEMIAMAPDSLEMELVEIGMGYFKRRSIIIPPDGLIASKLKRPRLTCSHGINRSIRVY